MKERELSNSTAKLTLQNTSSWRKWSTIASEELN